MSRAPSPARVREVLDLALERPARERNAYIAGVCGADERLRDEVASLMRALETGGDMLEPPTILPAPPAEPLTGLCFGAYRVAERVGEGGMGVVYRAEDTRLGRAVAVKALPAALARDPHRRARFEHEARILASLNHPNIAAIYGVEETARGPVLVLEFIPGETLAQRLVRGALPVDDAVAIGIQAARGLEAAHAAGVVHRDLKPANIQLTPDGTVKILDFGVAKQIAPGPGPDGDASRTLAGSLIGTAAYMSPEQARGRPVDRRTDLWALGCVFFEMLTGRRAFDGETASDTLAAVLRGEPDWSLLPRGLPDAVVRGLRRCLAPDADLRQRDAGDLRLDLLGQGEASRGSDQRPRRAVRMTVLVALALVLGALAGALWIPGRSASAPVSMPAPIRFAIELKPEQAVFVTPGGAMAISRDGGSLVFAGGPADRTRLYLRRLDSHDTVELPGTEDAVDPCFSPDGRWIAFRSDSQLRRVPASGGGAETLVHAGVFNYGLAWDDQGILYVGTPPGLYRLSAAGAINMVVPFAAKEEATPLHPEPTYLHPEPLPDGDTFLFTVVRTDEQGSSSTVEAVRRSGERRVVVPRASGARLLPSSRLVFWQAGALKSAPFDPATLRLTDTPTVVVQPLAGGELFQFPRFAVSPAGVLATLPGNIHYELTQLCWLGPDGAWREVARGWPGVDGPRLSPDGTRVAMLIGRAGGDVWVHDLQRSTRLRLTTGDYRHHPVWDRDGTRIIFTTLMPNGAGSLDRIGADGGAAETLWTAPDGIWAYATDVSPDGRLLLSLAFQGRPLDLFIFDPVTREAPTRLLPGSGIRYGARLSPDGTMIAYTSEETGTMEIYLQRFPSLEGKVRVSVNGGYRPVWSGDGRKLFFRYLDRLMVVDVSTSEEKLVLSPPRLMFDSLPDARYDMDREGKNVLLARPSGELGRQTRIDVLVWGAEGP